MHSPKATQLKLCLSGEFEPGSDCEATTPDVGTMTENGRGQNSIVSCAGAQTLELDPASWPS